jgi:cyclophilin family peptidyl-prolyl cis-trans isomerase
MATADDPETKVSILNHLEQWVAEPEVQATVRRALDDKVRNVRVEAIRLLRLAGAQAIPESAGESETRLEDNGYEMIAGARQDRTVAILETTRGRIEIDLFRQDAPVTVSNFVQLAKSGYFEGQSFMRVVPFFVVQTGDPRNDQEGGPGYTIRCEINERPFERGSVGMALAGKDTGGSQFFITLAPQPDLDGGYTCFGRVIAGMQVVDRLTPDDRIRRVTIEEDRAALNFRRF